MRSLFERQHRNAETGILDKIALNAVELFRMRTSGCMRRHADLQTEHTVVIVVRAVVQITRDHVQLPELLIECHTTQKVLYACINGSLRVAIDRRRLGGRTPCEKAAQQGG